MSYPVHAGQSDKRLQMLAVVVADGVQTALKTDLVVADIQSLVVQRVGAADVTVTVDSDDSNPDDAHNDGNVYNRGGGEYLVSVPDAAVATGAVSARLYGTWADGGDSGTLVGDTHPLVNYAWQDAITTILNRIGAFTGTGVNTILGFFKAIMFSDAAEPSDAGDTFAASLEEVRAAVSGVASGSTTTISLGVDGMRWWITTDEAGESVIASGVTGETGNAVALLINGNTYYMWARKTGYNDIIAQEFIAIAD